MHIKKTRHTFSDGTVKTQITLVESYRPGKGMNPRTRTIKDYGYLEDQKDPEKFINLSMTHPTEILITVLLCSNSYMSS